MNFDEESPQSEFNWSELHEKMEKVCNALNAKLSADKLDTILAERAEQLANSEEAEQLENNLDLLIFELGNEQYAIDTSYVAEVIPLKLITYVPNAPDFILGVVSRRGEIISVIDLGRFMNLSQVEECQSLIFLEYQKQQIGIAVHRLQEISQLPQASLQLLQSQMSSEMGHFISGVTETGLALLNVPELLSSDRLSMDLQ
jgi:purine-binding chemotaxis protein CheW